MSSRLILPTYLFYREGKEPVLFTGSTDKGSAEKTLGGEIVTYDNYMFDSRMVAYPGFVAIEAKGLTKEYMAGAKKIGNRRRNIRLHPTHKISPPSRKPRWMDSELTIKALIHNMLLSAITT
jgi:hypothetical protein